MKWIIRQGFENHLCTDPEQLIDNYVYWSGELEMTKGYIEWTRDGSSNEKVPIVDVVVNSQIGLNIISMDVLLAKGLKIKFSGKSCEIFRGETMVLCATLTENDYVVPTIEVREKFEIMFKDTEVQEESELQLITQEPEDWGDVQKMEESEQKIWRKAMNEEMMCLFKNEVLEVCEKPINEKIIGSRWTYSVKTNEKGKIVRARARLVARGCNQREGIDFFETFAPVVSHTTIRAFVTMAGLQNMHTNHCDIASAFLNGELSETIYMRGPESENEINFYKLKKAMYGLRQAAHNWNQRIHTSLINIGYISNSTDPCLYAKAGKVFVLIHVDDLLIASTDEKCIEETINQLGEEYTIKNLGEATKYLGICITRDRKENYFKLHQTPMIEKLVVQYGLSGSKPVTTPMSTDFLKNQEYNESQLLPNNVLYQKAVGSLLYLGLVTRPDIHLAVNIVSRRTSKPTYYDWEGVKRIPKYLNTTKNYKLRLGGRVKLELCVYSDADWGGDHETRKSTSGHLIYLGKSLVEWKSRRQKCVSMSTAEAEFVASAEAIQSVCWLKELIHELNIEQISPIILYSDNMSSIHMFSSKGGTKKSKHIDIKYHYLKDLLSKGIIEMKYCPTEIMRADVMTKPLGKPQYQDFISYMGLTGE